MSDMQVVAETSIDTARKSKYDYSQGPSPVSINLSWCKTCNICIALCPKKVFEADRMGKPVLARPHDCSQCAICWMHCPDFAITSNYR